MRGQEKDVGIKIACTNHASGSGGQKRSICMEQCCPEETVRPEGCESWAPQVMLYAQKNVSGRKRLGFKLRKEAAVPDFHGGPSLELEWRLVFK